MATGTIQKQELVEIFSGSVSFTNGFGQIPASSLNYAKCVPVYAVSTYNPNLAFIFGGPSIGDYISIGMPFSTGYTGGITLTVYGLIYN